MIDSTSKMVLQDSEQVANHGPLLCHIFREYAFAREDILARESLRQFYAWMKRRDEAVARQNTAQFDRHSRPWDIHERDVAAQIEATFWMQGLPGALSALRCWRPSKLRQGAARILVPRLIATGQADILDQRLTDDLIPCKYQLAVAVPLAMSGRRPAIRKLERAIVSAGRFVRLARIIGFIESEAETFELYRLNTILTACEVAMAHGADLSQILPVIELFASRDIRAAERLHVFQGALLDLLLRAHSLLEQIANREMSVDSFFLRARRNKFRRHQGSR